MTKISEALTYGLTVRESATDGSDFTNPVADYQRLFLGEDGKLHLRDSAGTVTVIGSAGDITTDTAWAAKGDLIVGTANNTAAILTAGTNGKVLVAASGEATGLKWDTAAAGALVLLEQHTAATSATLDFTAFISATYDEYVFEILDLLPATNASHLYMRVHTSGGWISAAKYQTAGFAWGYNGGAYYGNAVSSLAAQITTSNQSDTSNTAGDGIDGWVRLFAPSTSAAKKRILYDLVWNESGTGQIKGSAGRVMFVDTAAIDGFQFLMSSGNLASGTVRVYGLAK